MGGCQPSPIVFANGDEVVYGVVDRLEMKRFVELDEEVDAFEMLQIEVGAFGRQTELLAESSYARVGEGYLIFAHSGGLRGKGTKFLLTAIGLW